MDKISRSLNFCGIYMIINYVNNHRYVGSSKNLSQRLWEHRANLRHNKHDNPHLQNAWNKYGEISFNYVILEKCNEEERFEREQYYVNVLKPEYNICVEVVNQPPTSESTRKKQSETRKRMFASGELQITHNRVVFVYDKDGNFLGEWKSIRKASKHFGVSISGINGVLQQRFEQIKGLKFFYEKQETVEPFNKPKNYERMKIPRTVYILDDGNNQIEVVGLDKIQEMTGVKKAGILRYIKKNLKLNGKYRIYRKVPCE